MYLTVIKHESIPLYNMYTPVVSIGKFLDKPYESMGDVEAYFSNPICKLISWAHLVKFVLGVCRRTPLMISQH